MDHRQPPRIGSNDSRTLDLDASKPSPTVSRPSSRRLGRLAAARIGRAGVFAAAIAGLLVVGGSNVSISLVDWLYRRPEHRLAFREVELIPAPPRWIKPGREGLLEQVRDGRKPLESFSALNLNLDALLTDFRRNPWIARADGASKAFPNRVAIRLVYREPVAMIAGETGPTIVDHEGVVLPLREIDFAQAGHLAEILASSPTTIPRAGLLWPDDHEAGSPGEPSRVARAARLAGFLKARAREDATTNPQLTPARISTRDKVGLLVQMADPEGTFVLWTRYAAIGGPDEPSDAAKWAWLIERVVGEGGLEVSRGREYVDFDSEGLHVRKVKGAGGSRKAEAAD